MDQNINITKNTRVAWDSISTLSPEFCACPELRVDIYRENYRFLSRPQTFVFWTRQNASSVIALGPRMKKTTGHYLKLYINLTKCYWILHKHCHYFKIVFTYPACSTGESRLSNTLQCSTSYNTHDCSLLFCWQVFSPFKTAFSSMVCFLFLTSIHAHFRL